MEQLLELLDSGEDLFLTGMILQAFRSEDAARQIADYLTPFPLLPIESETCLAAVHLYRRCRDQGLGASTVDCHIAASAIENDCHVLTTDGDFERMARISPLELA